MFDQLESRKNLFYHVSHDIISESQHCKQLYDSVCLGKYFHIDMLQICTLHKQLRPSLTSCSIDNLTSNTVDLSLSTTAHLEHHFHLQYFMPFVFYATTHCVRIHNSHSLASPRRQYKYKKIFFVRCNFC